MPLTKGIFFGCLVFIVSSCFAQNSQVISKPGGKKKAYAPDEIIDPVYGITKFNKLCPALGGDSVRHNEKGYVCQGWFEDNYVNGRLLHKGFYADGQLKIFSNFFDNGQLERDFKVISLNKSTLDSYYPDGNKRSSVVYIKGGTQKWEDFFPDGKTEYVEEYEKDGETLIKMNSYNSKGQPTAIFELKDSKKRIYIKKDYWENGNIKEEGELIYNKSLLDYQKHGTWLYYSEQGRQIAEEQHIHGVLNKRIEK